MRKYSDVAVVMITRNEQDAIEKVIGDAHSALPGCTLFVIDGSTDQTPVLAKQSGAIVIREPGGGFGPALHLALTSPGEQFSIIVTVDADDTYPPEAFPQLVEIIRSGCDVAGSNRLTFLPTKNMPFQNWIANCMFNIVASFRVGRVVRDVHSGQRAYRREILHQFAWDYHGYAFPIDLLLWPAMSGLRFKEIPINYRKRIGESTLLRGPSGVASVRRLLRRRSSIIRITRH
jgi:glycosyltransferase involved in cell wall biosynthesis